MRRRVMVLLAAIVVRVGAARLWLSLRTQARRHEEEDGTDYGWIGLLGLAGLAGLLGRKRDDRLDRDRGTGSPNR